MTTDQLQAFFQQDGINKSGVCKEAGLSIHYINLILKGERALTPTTIEKLLPVMRKYGYGA